MRSREGVAAWRAPRAGDSPSLAGAPTVVFRSTECILVKTAQGGVATKHDGRPAPKSMTPSASDGRKSIPGAAHEGGLSLAHPCPCLYRMPTENSPEAIP